MSRTTQPTISLCMIVKNEETVLSRCLESVRGAVDEIVVVDTGSTDRTKAVAQEHGARVYDHPWQNSFSEARNHALQFVTKDWALILDADEELERTDIPDLKRVVRSNAYHAVFMEIYNYQPQGRTQLYSPRLFRRGKAQYHGFVHNQLHYEGKPLLSKIRVYHYGYNLSPEAMEAKYERSTKLLERQLEENPNDVFAWYNLIRMYRNRRQFGLAVRKGRRALKRLSFAGKENLFLMICYDTAASYLELGNNRAAETFCEMALARDPKYLDVLFTLGVVHMRTRDFRKAVEFFKQFLLTLETLRAEPKLHLLCLGTIDYDYLACALIGDCIYEMGNMKGASMFYRRALEFYARRGDAISRRTTPQKEILLQLGNVSVRIGDFRRATEFFEACLLQDQVNTQVLNNLASCYARLDECDKAIRLYQAALRVNPCYEEAGRNLQVLLKRVQRTPHYPLETVSPT